MCCAQGLSRLVWKGSKGLLEDSLTAGETIGKGSTCDFRFRCDCLQDTHIQLAMKLPPVSGLAVRFPAHSSSSSVPSVGGRASHLNVATVLFTFPRDFPSDPKMTEKEAIIVSLSYQLSSSILSLNSDPGRNTKQSHKSLLEALVINLPCLNSGPFLHDRLGDCTRFLLPRATFVLIGDHENIHDSFH